MHDPGWIGLALSYMLLVIPVALLLLLRLEMLSRFFIAIIRMTIQLLLVGFYLQVVFVANQGWLTSAWLMIMMLVATHAMLKNSNLRIRMLFLSTLPATMLGTIIPMLWFVVTVLRSPNWLESRFVIPVGGMILGNCLRSNIIGIREYYQAIHHEHNALLQAYTQGASRWEVLLPYARRACQAALAPSIGVMMTIGLVSLPGMMTGVILGGSDPAVAIRYQIAIMICIFTGSVITVPLAILFTTRKGFDRYGMPRSRIFTS